MRQLSRTHFTLLIPSKEPLQREFYAEMCRAEKWLVNLLENIKTAPKENLHSLLPQHYTNPTT